MTKQDLLNLIRESRPLLKEASPEQRYRFLALLRESISKVKNAEPQVVLENNNDYLDEI